MTDNKTNETHDQTLPTMRTKALLLTGVGAVLLFVLFFHLKPVFVCLVISLTLASALAPLAEKGERYKIPRVVTVILVYVIFGLIYSFLAASLVPTIKEQAHNLYEKIPDYSSSLTSHYASINEVFGSHAGQALE
ncbi:MAG: AI-2E family transporter, partial [Candidatus Obscuribacterales bacterium]|nr:AI-2E family transporter [Candidatus Obscuribacterales bacterium]